MDGHLVVRAQAGDLNAFARIVECCGDRFHAAALAILRDRALAEDACQAALLAIWRDLPALREPDRFMAWAHRLLVRACYAEARRHRAWLPPSMIGAPMDPEAPDHADAIAVRDELERGFRRLSLDHRTVVVLHHLLDLPLDEVAAIVGVPLHTARSRLYHAMRQLRAGLEADSRTVGASMTTAPEVAR